MPRPTCTNDYRDILARIGNVVGAPTMYYSSPENVIKELERRLQSIAGIVIEALNVSMPVADPDKFRQGLSLTQVRRKAYNLSSGIKQPWKPFEEEL